MSVSMYCSPTHLKLISGKSSSKGIDINGYAEIPLPDGAMINGIITSEDTMISFLKGVGESMNLFKEEVSLVIDNNSIRSKVMRVPPVNESTIMTFVERDMGIVSGVEKTNDVFDYSVLNPVADADGAKILAVAVSRELLETYKNVFEEAGFKLKNIDIGADSIIKIGYAAPQLDSTNILAIIDGKTLMLSLFEDGDFSITNRYRIMNSEGTPEWFNEIGGHVSSVIQFQKGQRSGSDVSYVFFAGLDASLVENLKDSLRYLAINVEQLDLSGIVRFGKLGKIDKSKAKDEKNAEKAKALEEKNAAKAAKANALALAKEEKAAAKAKALEEKAAEKAKAKEEKAAAKAQALENKTAALIEGPSEVGAEGMAELATEAPATGETLTEEPIVDEPASIEEPVTENLVPDAPIAESTGLDDTVSISAPVEALAVADAPPEFVASKYLLNIGTLLRN